jgi:hypothetical protein
VACGLHQRCAHFQSISYGLKAAVFFTEKASKGCKSRAWAMVSLALPPERTAAEALSPHGTVPAKSTQGINDPAIFNHAPNFS